ncbi:MAG: 3-deoxy-D-manno-octulosonic acid transferase [Bacteroidales bacterium]|nr:3-deoxy-D-manno-octulosonic acid transferase [Bacteroidales bacterium]
MFKLIYIFSVFFYSFVANLLSLFNEKAKLWVRGRKNIWNTITKSDANNTYNIWFHVSSLGEFEQARPLIEQIKNKYPEFKIVLTFFSPSGYEIRNNYKNADYIWYLPVDTPKNAKRFVKFIKPIKVFFVKYDFWYFYLSFLKKNSIPTYLVSGIFRQNQLFFKKIGKKYSKLLSSFTHFFVQNQESEILLNSLGYKNISVVGDTRFDRVIDIAENSKNFNKIEGFINNKFCIICGSTWPEDEKYLLQYANNSIEHKFIIAPHNIDEQHIINILQKINRPVIRYSKIEDQDLSNYQILIIDNIGMLASIYKYGKIAYVGGGFGAGIHNIIEAAVYGMPVVFGTNFKKFQEAKDLIEQKVAFSISDYHKLEHYFNLFFKDKNFLKTVSDKAKNYVYENKGATQTILKQVF